MEKKTEFYYKIAISVAIVAGTIGMVFAGAFGEKGVEAWTTTVWALVAQGSVYAGARSYKKVADTKAAK